MAIDFPSNPSVNDTLTVGNVEYTFDGIKWINSTQIPLVQTNSIGANELNVTTVEGISDNGSPGNALLSDGDGSFTWGISVGSIDDLSDGYYDGASSIGVGEGALENDDGNSNSNTAVGIASLGANILGTNNAAIGINSLGTNTGSNNTAIGADSGNAGSGNDITGSNITLLGYNAQPSSLNASNEITLGNSSVSRFRVPGINLDTADATDGQSLVWDGITEKFIWRAAGASITDDNATDSTIFPILSSSTDGFLTEANVSTNGLKYNPSTGTLEATDFNSLSDKRAKNNIHTIQNSIEKVSLLRGVSFEFNESGKQSIGLIAQETETVLPEVVNTGSDGLKSVSYGNIVGLLIEAIKEQQTQINTLQDKLLNK